MAIAWRYEQCCFLLWCQVIYKASRFGNTDFAVAHYAGEVVYSAETFLMKNTAKLSKELCRAFVVKQHECPSIYIYIVM